VRRNTFDEERRRRERARPEPHLDVRSLSDKLRLGEIAWQRVALAALLGNETASAAVGMKPDQELSSGFTDKPSCRRWLRAFSSRAPDGDSERVLLGLAAYSAFATFDLMQRPGFDPSASALEPAPERVRRSVHEIHAISNGIRKIIQGGLDGGRVASARRTTAALRSPASTIENLGEQANELWDEARLLHDQGESEAAGQGALWDVASGLYVMTRIFLARSSTTADGMATNNFEAATRTWARGDSLTRADWAYVSERVIPRMILELLPDLGRRPVR
jgi:hypothetical protein